MERFVNPLIIRARAVLSAKLVRRQGNCAGVDSCIELAVSPGPLDGTHFLTASCPPKEGIWRLHVQATCGCWSKLFFVPCEPVSYIGQEIVNGVLNSGKPKTGAMGGTHRPNPDGTTNNDLVRTCECYFTLGNCIANNAGSLMYRSVQCPVEKRTGYASEFLELKDNAGAFISMMRRKLGTTCGIDFDVPVLNNAGKIMGYLPLHSACQTYYPGVPPIAGTCAPCAAPAPAPSPSPAPAPACAYTFGACANSNAGTPLFKRTTGGPTPLLDNAGQVFTTLRNASGTECDVAFTVAVRDNANTILGYAPTCA